MAQRETYAQAKDRLLTELEELGWTISNRELKTPWAQAPDRNHRVWFKPQATLYGRTTRLGDARTTWMDRRELGVITLADRVRELCERDAAIDR